MRHLRMLAPFAAAVVAVTAFAGSASATSLTSPAGTTYTSTIKASSGKTEFHNASLGMTTVCEKSSFEGKVEQHGSTVTVKAKLSSLTLDACGATVTILAPGTLEIHTEVANSNGNGTVTSTGLTITIQTAIGFSCEYSTSNSHFGVATGGTPGIIHVRAALIRTGDSGICGSGGEWTGDYTVSTPSTLLVD